MPLYVKANSQPKLVTPEMLIAQEPGFSVVAYDNKRGCHDLYHVNSENQLSRFMLRKLDEKYVVGSAFHPYNHESKSFSTTPYRATSPLRFEPEETSFFTEEEIKQIKEQETMNLEPKISGSSFDIETTLTPEQQRQLVHGQVTHIPTQTFYDYITSLPIPVLEACIRVGNSDELSLSQDDETEIKVLRYTYLNPVSINAFSLVDLDKIHPTVGQIHDYYIQFIKAYILKRAPERANHLNALQTLTQTGSMKLGTPEPDFKNEGIYNPQGFTPLEDVLFRTVVSVISSQPQGLKTTLTSLFEREELKADTTKVHLIHLLDNIFQRGVNPKFIVDTQYEGIIRSIDAAYPGISTEGNLFELYKQLASTKDIDRLFGENEQVYALYCKMPSVWRRTQHLSAQLLLGLESAGLLSQENAVAIAKQRLENGSDIAKTILLLLAQEPHFFTQEIFDRLLRKHRAYPHTVKILLLADLLSKNNFERCLNHANPSTLEEILSILYQTRLLDQNSFDFVVQSKETEALSDILKELYEKQLLDAELFHQITHYKQPPSSLNAFMTICSNSDLLNPQNIKTWMNCLSQLSERYKLLKALSEWKKLDQEIFDGILDPRVNASDLAKVVYILKSQNILTIANLNSVIQSFQKKLLIHAGPLVDLHTRRLLDQVSFDAVISNRCSVYDPAKILSILKEKQLLTPENCRAVMRHAYYMDFSTGLEFLLKHHFLDQDHLDMMLACEGNKDFFAEILIMLHQTEAMFTRENCQALMNHRDLYNLLRVLEKCLKANVLDQTHFDRFVQHPDLNQLRDNPSEHEHLFFKTQAPRDSSLDDPSPTKKPSP